ncbi:MAG: C4-dicarboxylate TRAP transporter substrate-binding protein [Lawsonibacter sp.]|nr:C4-dicarboxylate TRAP transporter substrate-binding protein [Lawsonibacter sp.]
MKKKLALLLAAALCLSVCTTGCGKSSSGSAGSSTSSGSSTSTPSSSTPADVVTIQVGFENTADEPIGKAVQKWSDLVNEKSGGTMKLELFPNSALGSKSELIDQMVMGENIITIADGAFYADYGVPDMGIMYGPFFFESWDDVWKLLDSDWYADQCQKLADKGLTILASNWVYGERELMTTTKVVTPADLKGMKIRLANSQIYVEGFNALGATAVPMALGDVYTALQNGTLDGVENPLSTLYGQSFQEVTKYILMTGHIKNFTTWCVGTSYLSSLTPEQQELLKSTGEEAGLYNNDLQTAANGEYKQKLVDAGVEITDLTADQIAEWKDAGRSFYDMGSTFGWSDGLYETTQAAMGK